MAEEPIHTRRIGRYLVGEEIATGGMATVYVAHTRGVEGFARLVAIKQLHPPYARDPEVVAMFLNEARLAGRLHHPNVVPIMDLVTEGEEVALVMEFVDGLSLSWLRRVLRKQALAFPVDVVVRLIVDLLAGLHAAHQARAADGSALGLVHRDVSPQNVIVDRTGVARLLDFGVAKANRGASLTRRGQLKGKLAYMAPEQLQEGRVDARSDLYAAGILLWELLTGEPLFAAADDATTFARALAGAQVSPRQRRPELAPALDDVVMRALAVAPADRFDSAAAFAAALCAAVPPATHPQVAAFVEPHVGATLDARALRIQQWEASLPTEDTSMPTTAAGESLLARARALQDREAAEAVTARLPVPAAAKTGRPSASSGRRVWSWGAGAAVILVLAGATALRLEGPASERPARDAAHGRPARGFQVPTTGRSAVPPAPGDAGAENAAPTARETSARAPTPPPAVRRAASRKAKRPTPAPAPDCRQPFTVDPSGVRIPRPECLR